MAGGDAGVSDLNTGGSGSGAITARVAAFSDVPAGAHRGTAGLAPSVLVSALARLRVDTVERELRPGRLSLFAGPGTLGRIALDLRKCAGGSLAGFGIARRSCGRPAGGPAYKSPRASSWLSVGFLAQSTGGGLGGIGSDIDQATEAHRLPKVFP